MRGTPSSPNRMKRFATFFRGYMGSAPIIAAVLPIPITAGKVIPTYLEHTSFLTAYASMFCFLAVAYIFYRRHRIGMYMIPENWGKRSRIIGRLMVSWLPLLFILFTALSIIVYHWALYASLEYQPFSAATSVSEILQKGSIRTMPFLFQALFFSSYFGIFVFSTLAFALMAVREYMQTELGLSETDLVYRSCDPQTEPIQ